MSWNSLLVLVLIVLQTAVWFAMTIIGVVIFSGRFFSWPRLEQVVATLRAARPRLAAGAHRRVTFPV